MTAGAPATRPGAGVHRLLDGTRRDPLPGTAVPNGFPVTVTPAATPVVPQS